MPFADCPHTPRSRGRPWPRAVPDQDQRSGPCPLLIARSLPVVSAAPGRGLSGPGPAIRTMPFADCPHMVQSPAARGGRDYAGRSILRYASDRPAIPTKTPASSIGVLGQGRGVSRHRPGIPGDCTVYRDGRRCSLAAAHVDERRARPFKHRVPDDRPPAPDRDARDRRANHLGSFDEVRYHRRGMDGWTHQAYLAAIVLRPCPEAFGRDRIRVDVRMEQPNWRRAWSTSRPIGHGYS